MSKRKKTNGRNRDHKGLYFIPLGGSEQFGANLNVYDCDGELLAVDCGIGFADERFPGIDLLLPDPAFLEQNKSSIKGMVITHAHEDHVGAVARLWPRLKCPIYAGEFTAAVLREKFKEENIKRVKIHILEPMVEAQIGAFTVQAVPVSHSVPGTSSLFIETSYGRVVHSGDWNLDPAPIVGDATDGKVFQEYGAKGVLAYVGDSTNSGVKGRSGSESEVEDGLEEEFKKCRGKIAVTIFSSNIGRIISIARAAKKADRSICVIGRSLHRMIGCARDCGYMDEVPDFISEEDVGYLPDENVVLILTGSQGENRAALAKMARGGHRSIKFKPDDTVIFSARAIPGNERHVNQVKNHLSAAKVNIVTPKDTKHVIHVSGHPCQDEIADMLQWVKPKIVVPVHGERMQLDSHADLARDYQIENVIVPNNGSVVKLSSAEPRIVDHVETGLLAVDQKRIIGADHGSISQRRKLQYTGVVHVSVAVDHRGDVLGQPKLETVGLIDDREEAELQIEDDLYQEIMDILDDMEPEDRQDDHFISEELRIGVRRFVVHVLGIKPKATIQVIRV